MKRITITAIWRGTVFSIPHLIGIYCLTVCFVAPFYDHRQHLIEMYNLDFIIRSNSICTNRWFLLCYIMSTHGQENWWEGKIYFDDSNNDIIHTVVFTVFPVHKHEVIKVQNSLNNLSIAIALKSIHSLISKTSDASESCNAGQNSDRPWPVTLNKRLYESAQNICRQATLITVL